MQHGSDKSDNFFKNHVNEQEKEHTHLTCSRLIQGYPLWEFKKYEKVDDRRENKQANQSDIIRN